MNIQPGGFFILTPGNKWRSMTRPPWLKEMSGRSQTPIIDIIYDGPMV
ncbi:TPA: hypothetical protein LC240_001591 [Salmonella enterica subsp. arizonae serovar 21:z4,z23:-]|nr:hypothetical protein [Salmonella enterica subsp. arizonae serovar 21:z4,z23:-]